MHNLLIEAVELGHLEAVKKIIEKGANIRYRDSLSVRIAITRNYPEIVDTLLKAGANCRYYLEYQPSFAHPEVMDVIQKHYEKEMALIKKGKKRVHHFHIPNKKD